MRSISIIGSGGMAAAIGSLAAKAGYVVEIAARDAAKARALAEEIGAGARTGGVGAAPAGHIVVLAIPYSAVRDVVQHDIIRWPEDSTPSRCPIHFTDGLEVEASPGTIRSVPVDPKA